MTDRLSLLLSFHEDDPGDEFTRFAIAQEYLKRDDTANALRFFTELVTHNPDYVGTYYHLGKLYERLDNSEDAVFTYRTGIEIASKLSDFHARSELQTALQDALGIGFD